jgi:hypothetical protein
MNIAGVRLVTTYMWQTFCWSHGHINSVGDVKKKVDWTAAGQATTWRFDGWRDGPNGWTNYGNKYHGGHFTNKTAKFKGCIPSILFGCIDVKSVALRHSILEHAGGQWWGNVTAE